MNRYLRKFGIWWGLIGFCVIAFVAVLLIRKSRNAPEPNGGADLAGKTEGRQGALHNELQHPRESRPASSKVVEVSLAGCQSLAEFDQKWEQVAQSGLSVEERLQAQKELVSLGCRAGFGDQILARILANTGEGSDRNSYIQLIFSTVGTPVDKIAGMLDSLTNDAEKKKATAGLATRIGRSESIEVLNQLMSSKNAMVWKALEEGLGNWVGSYRLTGTSAELANRLEEINNLLKEHAPEKQAQLLSKAIYGASAGADAFAIWSFLASSGLANAQGFDKSATNRVVFEMARTDRERALSDLMRSRDSSAFGYAIDYLVGKDNQWASDWFDKNKKQLDPACKDSFLKSLASAEIKRSNLPGASDFTAQIEDPEIASAVEGSIFEMQKKEISNQLAKEKDPATYLAALASNSKEQPNLLGYSIAQWVAKDASSAAQWCNDQWATLPQACRNQSAAALAEGAIGQGDFDIAERWMAMVQDAELTKMLNSKIEKARKK